MPNDCRGANSKDDIGADGPRNGVGGTRWNGGRGVRLPFGPRGIGPRPWASFRHDLGGLTHLQPAKRVQYIPLSSNINPKNAVSGRSLDGIRVEQRAVGAEPFGRSKLLHQRENPR